MIPPPPTFISASKALHVQCTKHINHSQACWSSVVEKQMGINCYPLQLLMEQKMIVHSIYEETWIGGLSLISGKKSDMN